MDPTDEHSSDDAGLVRLVRQGDRDAFDRLAERHRAGLLAIARLRVAEREEAEDLVQEALLTAWSRLGELREERAFGAWLGMIAINACRQWQRRRVRWPASVEELEHADLLPDPTPGPLEAIIEREQWRLRRQALLVLPEGNRIPLLLHVFGSASYEEIARLLGVPVTTVEGRIHRAKKTLRRLLRDDAAELLGEPRGLWQKE